MNLQVTCDQLRDAGVQGIYGPGSNVVECAADMLRLYDASLPHYQALEAHKLNLAGEV